MTSLQISQIKLILSFLDFHYSKWIFFLLLFFIYNWFHWLKNFLWFLLDEKKRVESCTLSKQEKGYSKGFLVWIRRYKITEYLGVRTKSSVFSVVYEVLCQGVMCSAQWNCSAVPQISQSAPSAVRTQQSVLYLKMANF